jgi:hypothetical protein
MPAIEAMGFTRRQSSFLALATLYSGYFLRRQYGEWSALSSRASTILSFTTKLVRYRYARPFVLRGHVYLYQLYSRSLYDAAGDPRRDHQGVTPLSVLRRVRMLDFVLGRNDCELYPTVDDKMRLMREYGVPLDRLPSGAPPFGGCPGATGVRYFPEQWPLFRRPGDPGLWVAYVWAERTIMGFRTFLRRYLPLLHAVPRGGVTLVIPRHAATSASACARLFQQVVREGVLGYFRDRSAWERGDRAGFSVERAWQFRQDSARYAGEKYEALYRRWQVEGDAVLWHEGDPAHAALPVFEVYELPYSYEQFGPWAAY